MMIVVDTRKKNKCKVFKIKGTEAFRGSASGKALLIDGLNKKIELKSNYILIAVATYPRYLPMMLKARGIITEVGGVLSHAAIVAREFRIPCIVGVKNATSKIKNGDIVTIKPMGVVIVRKKQG